MKPSKTDGARVNFKLGQVEQVLLVAIEALKDDACVPQILKWVEANSHLRLSVVATYTMLSRLEKKGTILSKAYSYGKTLRRHYTVSPEGKDALDELFYFQAYLTNIYDNLNQGPK